MAFPGTFPSPFKSLEKLSSIMKLVDPDEIAAKAGSRGLELVDRGAPRLSSGKVFFKMIFRAGKR